MLTVLSDNRSVHVPFGVNDLEAFRRWTYSDDFPHDVEIWWLDGEVWIDLSRKQIFTHVRIETEMTATLCSLADEQQSGIYLMKGALFTNVAADFSGNPDGLFLSAETLASDRVRLLEGSKGGFTELQGSPDMVLEILSDSSEKKDSVSLRERYHQAGIREYWMVDVRDDSIGFDILRATTKRYVRTRKEQGWVKSAVFGRSFRLEVRAGLQGHPDYNLEVR